jgi:hypothetical protein
MFTIQVRLIRKQEEFDAFEALKEFPRANRAAFEAVGKFHVTTIIPRHFLPGAKYAYKHNKRSPKYLRYKRRLIARLTGQFMNRDHLVRGEVVDLIYSGNLRREATTQSLWKANSERGIVNIRGRVLNLPPRAGSAVDMKAEMTYMTPKELKEVETIFTEEFENKWAKRLQRKSQGIRPGKPAKSTHAI